MSLKKKHDHHDHDHDHEHDHDHDDDDDDDDDDVDDHHHNWTTNTGSLTNLTLDPWMVQRNVRGLQKSGLHVGRCPQKALSARGQGLRFSPVSLWCHWFMGSEVDRRTLALDRTRNCGWWYFYEHLHLLVFLKSMQLSDCQMPLRTEHRAWCNFQTKPMKPKLRAMNLDVHGQSWPNLKQMHSLSHQELLDIIFYNQHVWQCAPKLLFLCCPPCH